MFCNTVNLRHLPVVSYETSQPTWEWWETRDDYEEEIVEKEVSHD